MDKEELTILLKSAINNVSLTRHYDTEKRKKWYVLTDGIFNYNVDFREVDGGVVLRTVDADGQRWRSDVTTLHELKRKFRREGIRLYAAGAARVRAEPTAVLS